MNTSSLERARERLGLLGDASTGMGTSLDITWTAQELADIAVPLLADYVSVDLAEPVLLGEQPQPSALGGSIPVFRRVAAASVHHGFPESLWKLGEDVFVPLASPFTWVLSSGKAHWEPVMDTSKGSWLDQDPARAEVIRRTGMHSLIILPIRARGAVLGVAVFVRNDNPEPFDKDNLLLAEELVARAGLHLDNARRFLREHTTALALQRKLLPRSLSGAGSVDVASRYLPADIHNGVGGDWFDVIPLSSARVALVVGDVVGHGVNSAATMGQLRTAVRTLADMDLPPDQLLAHLDDMAIRIGEEEAEAEEQPATVGATCLYAVYDPITRLVTMASAGHPPPAIRYPDGEVGFLDVCPGAPLGVGLLPFESVETQLPAGSLLALYTDGLVETRTRDIDVGMERLAKALSHPCLSLQELCTAVTDSLLPNSTPTDDAALLIARTRPVMFKNVISWELPQDPSAVSDARHLAVGQLAKWGISELAPTTELLVSELVTNATRYASGPIRLRLIRHQLLICEVSDASHTSPTMRHARAMDEGGRGLYLVAQLSHRWGTRSTAAGKIIWAEQELGLHEGTPVS